MTDYIAPLDDMRFALSELASLDELRHLPALSAADEDVVEQILKEAAKFAREVWGPLNVIGDREGCRVENGEVVVPTGFSEAYGQFVESGWRSLEFSAEYGGMGLPNVVAMAVDEMWQSANLAFALCPLLSGSAISAVEAHATEEIKNLYLPKMVSGEWTATMNLTEPQAGSDLAAIKTKAEPQGDHFRISGDKIFITWGDQPFSENVIHLVLARLPDAPPGVRGISLFLVPKYMVDADGNVGERNGVRPVSVEHKLGIHASPTCVMNFGESGDAVGYLIGEENNGLACMFTMMNHARLGVGVQGLSISERAYQLAVAYAKDRIQGTIPGRKERVAIIEHPDVRRMLMVMRSQIEAMRAAGYVGAATMDLAHHAEDPEQREWADARLGLLTPILKAWMTELSQEITSLGVQVHGGMGFVEETGAAQHMRDARILTIYEGTTGIQGMDLVGRKMLSDSGKAVYDLVDEMRSFLEAMPTGLDGLDGVRSTLSEAVDELGRTVVWILGNAAEDYDAAGSAAVNFLMQAGTVMGGWQLARAAVVSSQKRSTASGFEAQFFDAKIKTTKFYFDHIMPRARAFAKAATSGGDSVMSIPVDSF